MESSMLGERVRLNNKWITSNVVLSSCHTSRTGTNHLSINYQIFKEGLPI